MEVVTYRIAVDGRAHACFGVRVVAAVATQPSGSCLDPQDLPNLENEPFGETTGSGRSGLVTLKAATVRAHLRNDPPIEMTPYRHPALPAGVYAFVAREGANILRIEALDADGQVLGALDL